MIVYTDKLRVPFQIDEPDYEAVSRYSWRIGSGGYPTTSIGTGTTGRPLELHTFLLGRAPRGFEHDHENRDKLDNRRLNLRTVTHVVNARNVGLQRDNTSGAKGVSRHKASGRWRADIRVAGRLKYLGLFDTVEAATAARRAAESESWCDGRV